MESCQPNKRLKGKKKRMCVLAFVFTFSGPVCKHKMITISHVILFKYSNHSAAPYNTICSVLGMLVCENGFGSNYVYTDHESW